MAMAIKFELLLVVMFAISVIAYPITQKNSGVTDASIRTSRAASPAPHDPSSVNLFWGTSVRPNYHCHRYNGRTYCHYASHGGCGQYGGYGSGYGGYNGGYGGYNGGYGGWRNRDESNGQGPSQNYYINTGNSNVDTPKIPGGISSYDAEGSEDSNGRLVEISINV